MRGRLVRSAVTAVLALAGVVGVTTPAATAAPVAAPARAAASACVASAHLQDASHSGAGCGLRPGGELAAAWTATLNGTAQYPLLADGAVFVSTSNPGGRYGGSLYALDAATGAVRWGPIPLAGTYYTFNLAYGAGRVFAVNFDGDVTAFSARNGRQVWSATTESFSGEPVVLGDTLYLSAGNAAFAFDVATGRQRWVSATRFDGGDGAIAVDATGVYVAGDCSRQRFDTATGSVRWDVRNGCSGGVSATVYATRGRVYDSARNYAVRTSDGRVAGTYGGQPAFVAGVGYFAAGRVLSVQDAVTRTLRYTATLPSAALTHPVVADGVVYLGAADQRIYALDAATGAVLTTTAIGAAVAGDLAVGQGRLVVPSGRTLVAFG